MKEICWLHLSDMHINAKNSSEQKLVHEALLEDIKTQLHENKLKISFLFFTGDVAFNGTAEDYEFALEFFMKLVKVLKIKNDSLYIVPGNHDVNRLKVSKFLDDERKNFSTREDIEKTVSNSKLFNHYLARFDHFSNFVSNFQPLRKKINSKNYFFTDLRKAGGIQVGIIGLNSAWAAYGGRNDSNNIYLSEKQVKQAIDEVKWADIKIVLMHHPISWLFEEDKVDAESLFYKNCQIILHGHLHRPDFQVVNSIKGQQIVIPAGAIYSGRRISNTYNFAKVDLEKQKISIWPRRYYEGPRKFMIDIESLGKDNSPKFEAKIPKGMGIKNGV